jgi:hypothetical protein
MALPGVQPDIGRASSSRAARTQDGLTRIILYCQHMNLVPWRTILEYLSAICDWTFSDSCEVAESLVVLSRGMICGPHVTDCSWAGSVRYN